ncbi:hypothetical protein [Vibrio fluvialis]|uniref:hypothetical protein n=1 Tax=Vibrio fluvialis TaxID=676 RepID=UPI001F3B2EEE|nr:hypothetical protein [Vibrio fluvialis]MCE7607958.1 hypothetical protein [Vibrio fluvialis]
MPNIEQKNFEVFVPIRLCLYEEQSQRQTLDFFVTIEDCLAQGATSITINFSELNHLSAAAANHLFALVVFYQLQINNNLFRFKMPKDRDMKRKFSDTGLHKALMPGGLRKLSKLWNDSDFLCGSNADVTKLVQVVKDRCGVNPFPQKLSAAIKETFLNIHHHAYDDEQLPEVTWFCYFYVSEDENGRYLSTIIQDMGKGVVKSIRDAFSEYIHKPAQLCIQHAMTRSVSSTMEEGRGQGSENIQKPLLFNSLKGNDILYVMSDSGSYIFEVNSLGQPLIQTGGSDRALRGTLVEWTLYY